MPCYYPLKGWLSREVTPNGKKTIVFDARLGYADMQISVPCGRCVGCRADRVRDWSTRLMHEAQMHDASSFLTLTYRPECLPDKGSLVKDDVKLFLKRLRSHLSPQKVRYFYCGEYGENFHRPHYHVILFGYDFPDRESLGGKLYISSLLTKLWPHGYHTIGTVTPESCAYVAQYCLKKFLAEPEKQAEYYQGRLPEFSCMSLKPGIGALWLEQYVSDIYPRGVLQDGDFVLRPPRYYDKLYGEVPDGEKVLKRVKAERLRRSKTRTDVGARLHARAVCKKAAMKSKGGRSYEG